MNILLLEDDPGQAALYESLLERAGHACDVYGDAKAFLAGVRGGKSADVMVIDWMLPDLEGEAVLTALRQDLRDTTPVVVLTVRDDENVVVRALEAGADDFVVKPAKPREFLARLQALARRFTREAHAAARPTTPTDKPATASMVLGAYEFDLSARVVRVASTPATLTSREYDLAAYLFANPGALHSRTALLDAVWGVLADLDTRTVDTHVSRLRRRLQLDGRHGARLVPVYGFGYRLELA